VELHAGGKSNRQIARELSVSVQTISNWLLNAPPTEPAHASPPTPAEPLVKPRATIADVAKHAGVSTSTISNYLNDKGRMSQETRLRIEDAMKALYFTPSALVHAIRHRRMHTIGLVAYGIYNMEENVELAITPTLLSAINRAADHVGYNVLLYTGWPHRPRSRTGSDFLNGQIDGLLWMSPPPYHPQLRFAAAGGLPVVSIMSRRVPSGVGYVVSDNFGGTRDLVGYLAGLGHRRIALLGSNSTSDFLDRNAGYHAGLALAQLPDDPEIASTEMKFGWDQETLNQVLDRWLRLADRPTAIITIEDGLAAKTIEAIRERGLRVPEDVAVTGFNGLPASAHQCGGITTIQQPLSEIGRISLERLYAMIQGAPASECRITVPSPLMIRASTERQIARQE
jgi:LacI family transcriptional regulator